MSQIITLDDLEAYSPTTLDAGRAQLVVDAMNGWVETRTGRVWGETKQIEDERYNWSRTLWLRHPDVVSVDSMTVGWPGQTQSTLDPNGYFVNNLGRVTQTWPSFNTVSGGSPLYNDYLGVTYTYGVLDVPDDLKLATLGIASGFYNYAANSGQDVVAASVGSYHLQYAGSVRGAGTGTPDPAKSTADANWAIIDSYRIRRV